MFKLIRSKIFVKQFTAFILVIFITFFSISTVLILVTEKSIEEQQLSTVEAYRIEASQRMYEWLKGRIYYIKSQATYLEQLGEATISSEKLTTILSSQLSWNENYYDIGIVDQNGNVINSIEGQITNMNLSDRPYVINGLKGESTVTGFFIERKNGYPIMAIAEPIIIDGEPKYVLAGLIKLERFKEVIDSMEFGELGHVYLVDKEGMFITDTEFISEFIENGSINNKEQYKINSKAVNEVIQMRSGTGIYKDFMNEKVFGSYEWLEMLQVGIIVEFKDAIAMAPTHELIKVIVILGFTGSIAGLLVSYFLSKRITDPVQELIGAVENVTAQNYQEQLDITTNSELDILIEQFNLMKHAIKEREELLEKKNMELIIQRGEAIEANKLKSQFMANISHELRTPLNSIIGFTTRVLKKTEDILPVMQRENLVIVKDEANNLLQLINSLLDYSIIESGKMNLSLEMFNLINVMKEIRPIVHSLIGDKPIVYKEHLCNKDYIPIYSDRIKVKQILLNLLSNAVKYSEKGIIQFSIDKTNKGYCIKIEDEGVGIAPEYLDYIFHEFKQVDGSNTRKVGGTGLGLSITKRFIEILGGNIEVTSTIGLGSCFTVYLSEEATCKEDNFEMSN